MALLIMTGAQAIQITYLGDSIKDGELSLGQATGASTTTSAIAGTASGKPAAPAMVGGC